MYSLHGNCVDISVLHFVAFQEKNRLFILDLFRNCVDRVSNMRNFIARIAPSAHVVGTPGGGVSGDSRGGSGGSIGGTGSVVGGVKRECPGGGTVDVYSIDLCSDDEHATSIPSIRTSTSSTSAKRQYDAGSAESKHEDAPKRAHTHTGVTTVHSSGDSVNCVDIDDDVVCISSGNVNSSTTSIRPRVSMKWTCTVCTYCHVEPGSELYLQCTLCGSPRCI